MRHLGLTDVSVANERVEDLATRSELQGAADLVTMRAVSPSRELWGSIRVLLKPGGRLFWFGGRPDEPFPNGLEVAHQILATPPNNQVLIVTLA